MFSLLLILLMVMCSYYTYAFCVIKYIIKEKKQKHYLQGDTAEWKSQVYVRMRIAFVNKAEDEFTFIKILCSELFNYIFSARKLEIQFICRMSEISVFSKITKQLFFFFLLDSQIEKIIFLLIEMFDPWTQILRYYKKIVLAMNRKAINH